MKFEYWKAKDGQWYWHLKARNGRIIAYAGEGYKRKAKCLKSLNEVRTKGSTAPIKELW